MIKAVLFDFDGVIVHSEEFHKKTFEELLGISVDENRWFREFAGTGSGKIFARLLKENKIEASIDDLIEKRRLLFDVYVDQGKVPLIPGLKDFMEILKQKNIRTAIASGGHRGYIEKLNNIHGLSFDFVISADDIPYRKPDPKVFLTAAKALDVKPEECLVIEDSYSGAQAAKAAGMKLVWFRPHPSLEAPDCDLVSEDFTDQEIRKLL
ncbi:HAD family phosphatase [Candidatus Micrarchaeota archaeon]|nr:HAD family phosphatase [Candidatus Micrarchaeota archaeon]